jgi:hypothetical protein
MLGVEERTNETKEDGGNAFPWIGGKIQREIR